MSPEVKAERERCAAAVNELADIWEATAALIEKEGTFITRSLWPPFKEVTFIGKRWADSAKTIRIAAEGVRTIHKIIVEGWKKK